MCEHGVNIAQLRLAIGQADDALAMSQQWLEQLHHLADHGDSPAASAHVAQATVLLGEVRGKLEAALKDLDAGNDSAVTVERV